jgi:hypothetical protein
MGPSYGNIATCDMTWWMTPGMPDRNKKNIRSAPCFLRKLVLCHPSVSDWVRLDSIYAEDSKRRSAS